MSRVMDSRYTAWIAQFIVDRRKIYANQQELTDGEIVRGACHLAATHMRNEFPELRRVRGWYNSIPHWWCTLPDGTIVDPTAAQFAPGGVYEEFREGIDPEPLGKCLNCSALVWTEHGEGGASACSDECYAELKAYYNIR